MDIVLRSALAFVTIFLLTRLIGRRELSSMQPFDVILLVVVGDLVQQGVTQSDYSVTGMLLSLGTIGLLTMAVSYLAFRSRRLRPLLEARPLVLVTDGRVVLENLRRERISEEELAAEARLAQIGNLADVRFAILETNGRISFVQVDARSRE